MAVCPEVKAIYEETIKEFTFRNSDGITIPKDVRENAYTLAIDIVIVSTRREVYKNYGVSPAEGFYGNATLVMQDMCELKIPVKMPRQRLYYGRVAEAFQIWQSLVDWSYFQSYMTAIGESLVSLGTALGAGFVPSTNCCSLPDRSWIELPLREVYFNCPNGTQYKIEVSWYKALQITDGCGNIRDPRSKTVDGDKDTGLPPNGIQPNVATDSQNPFANLPLPSTNAEQAGFSNSKLDNLDNIDPNNIPLLGTFAHVTTMYWATGCNKRLANAWYLGNSADDFSLQKIGETPECGDITSYFNINANVSGLISGGVPSVGSTITVVKELHANKPENTDVPA